MPQVRPFTNKFFRLSYYNHGTGKYSAGYDDFYFIAFCILLFTGLRAGSMQYILAPLARHWGVSKRKEVTRFSEQGWMLLYYSVFWPLGMVFHTPVKEFRYRLTVSSTSTSSRHTSSTCRSCGPTGPRGTLTGL
jgi:hypothetical protein